jgi:serine/threonine-protein kinase
MRVTLTVVGGPHAGRVFAFEEHDTFFVGRSAKAHFCLPKHDRYFSRMHFLVETNPPLVRVTDLGSRNGTHVNGKRIESVDLVNGDRIKAGRTVLEVAIEGAPRNDHRLPTLPGGTCEELAARFAEDWRAARGPRIEEFIPGAGGPDRPRVLKELVRLEMELRLAANDPVRVEDYVKRFPELGDDPQRVADLVTAEYALRHDREPGLNIAEYHRRFPGLRDRLASRLPPINANAATLELPASTRQPPNWPRIPGYLLEEELGRGGMGVVYRAVREADNRSVAIKTIRPAVAAGQLAIERFVREAEILRRLNHRHIVAFRELGESAGVLWFAMDLVPGTNSARLVEQEGPLELRRAVGLMLPVLGALAYAHAEKFVHRDIKPANLLVTKTPGGEEARLADFGLARTYQASPLSGLTVVGAIAGTPAFMAPEQVLSLREVKPAADQYSAAATLYFLLTGQPPYDRAATTQMQILRILDEDPVPLLQRGPDLPRELGDVLHRALSREPSDRYPNISAFAAAVSLFAS